MRALITGSQGFAGRHLIRELQKYNWSICGFDLASPGGPSPNIDYFQGDIQDSRAIENAVRRFQPDACFHLGGIAFVPEGWKNTEILFSINSIGAVHLLEACRHFAPRARILFISSSEVYGQQSGRKTVKESDVLSPANPYAVSKAAADYVVRLYAQQYSMPVIVARPCNHIGPGQSTNFAVSSFASQLAAMARQKSPSAIKVGNLESSRDFTDVRDVVRAYRLLMEKGRAGEAYNIASNREVTLRFILEQLCSISKIKPVIEVDPQRHRPAEPRPRLDTTKIEKEIKWKPEIAIETTLRDIMDEARFTVQSAAGGLNCEL